MRLTLRLITPHALCSPVAVHGDWECDACRAVRRLRRCFNCHASRPHIARKTAGRDRKLAVATALATNLDGSADAGQLCAAESLLQMQPREANVNPGVRGRSHVMGRARIPHRRPRLVGDGHAATLLTPAPVRSDVEGRYDAAAPTATLVLYNLSHAWASEPLIVVVRSTVPCTGKYSGEPEISEVMRAYAPVRDVKLLRDDIGSQTARIRTLHATQQADHAGRRFVSALRSFTPSRPRSTQDTDDFH